MQKYLFVLGLLPLTTLAIIPPRRIIFTIPHHQKLSIKSAIHFAWQARPALRKFDFDLLASHALERAALSGYLPQIVAKVGTGAAKLDFFSPKTNVDLTMTQLLYSFAGPLQQYQMAEQDTKIIKAEQLLTKDRVRIDVETSMLDLWNIEQKLRAIKQYDQSSKITFRRDGHQEKLGLLNLTDWLKATSQFAQAQAIINEYGDNVTIAQSNAEKGLGIGAWQSLYIDDDEMISFIDQAINQSPHYDNNRCFQQALQYRKELPANADALQKELYQQRFYERSYFPTISLFMMAVHYVYGQRCTPCPTSSFLTLFDIFRFTGWRLGFQLDWQFDGLANVFNASAAEERSHSLTMQRLDLIETIKNEVTNAHSTLQIALKDLDAAKVAYAYAKNQYALNQKLYEIGQISPVEFEEATTQWEKAQIDLTDRKVQVAKKRSELLFACGYPKEE